MPFNQNYPYGTGTQEITHLSVPALGTTIVRADFTAMYINGIAVGLVQRFSPRETREAIPQYEIGDIYVVEYVPSVWQGSLEVGRLMIFKDTIMDALQYNTMLNNNSVDLLAYWPSNKFGPVAAAGPIGTGSQTSGAIVTTLADIQWPIDIQLHITNPAPEVNGITVKTYQEAWMTSYNTSFDSGAKVVLEGCTFNYRNTTVSVGSIANPGFASTSSVGLDFNQLITNPV